MAPRWQQPIWTEKNARKALRDACRELRLNADQAEPLHLGTNALFRLGDTVLRLAPAGVEFAAVQRELEVARCLTLNGVGSIEPMLPAPFALKSGAVATLWRYVEHDPATTVSPRAFGELLRAFHRALGSLPCELPALDARAQLAERLEQLEELQVVAADDIELLRERFDAVSSQLSRPNSALGVGPLHGDAHPESIIVGRHGPVFCDFESACRGPREWDLIARAVHHERFGGDERAWRAFCAGYGYDVREWPAFKAFATARALSITCFALERTAQHRNEAERRLRFWRGDRRALVWQPI
jgi:hypothetical protein